MIYRRRLALLAMAVCFGWLDVGSQTTSQPTTPEPAQGASPPTDQRVVQPCVGVGQNTFMGVTTDPNPNDRLIVSGILSSHSHMEQPRIEQSHCEIGFSKASDHAVYDEAMQEINANRRNLLSYNLDGTYAALLSMLSPTGQAEFKAFVARRKKNIVYQPQTPQEPEAAEGPEPPDVAWVRQRALAGNVAAERQLGMLYALGAPTGVPDPQEAEKWYRRAAEHGDARAQFKLGLIYMRGLGVEPNMQEAVTWYEKAAAQGNIESMRQLGDVYENGVRGVPKSGSEALSWYVRAAEKGDLKAELKAGYIFRDGLDDVPHDYEQGLKWFRKAADKNNGEGEFNVGYMYQEGLGESANPHLAAEWYKKAIEHNFTIAAVALRNLNSVH